MNAANMLSANKVKLHGMTSDRWTTRDKISQYKGLIKLYTRDKKIMEIDKAISEKKQKLELKNVQKEIEKNRQQLDNAIQGDQQKLRNTLAEHREMQLAYQYSQPEKVIDMVHQVNFNKRKSRDLLKYKMKLRTQRLVDLKLTCALKEDILKMECVTWGIMLPSERQAQIITGKVQDAILKKEAAIAIRHSYKEMIAIMKKDALYFDAILEAIRNDGINQGKCMINAIKLGQVATEYLDDRRQEYKKLEKVVKRDIINRKSDLDNVRKIVVESSANIKNLLRRDSDMNLCNIELEPSISYAYLVEDINNIEATLRYLKDATLVPNFDTIFPCLQEQVKQKERLTEMVAKGEENRNRLLDKSNRATVQLHTLKYTMLESTSQYNSEKHRLMEEIRVQKENAEHMSKLVQSRHELLAKVRCALKHMNLLTKLLVCGRTSFGVRHLYYSDVMATKPSVEEIDGTKIIPELTKKLTKLAEKGRDNLVGGEIYIGYNMFEELMCENTKSHKIEIVMSEESLIEAIFLDAHILTRDDIKKQSDEIVQANEVGEDMLPVTKPKK